MWGKPATSVRKRPTSISGCVPGWRRRRSLSISFEPTAIEVLLCSALRRRISATSTVTLGSKAEVVAKTSLPCSVGISRCSRMSSMRQAAKSLEPAAPKSRPVRGPRRTRATANSIRSASSRPSSTPTGTKYSWVSPLASVTARRGSRKRGSPPSRGPKAAQSTTFTPLIREPLAPNQRRLIRKGGTTVRSKATRSRPAIRLSMPPVRTIVNSSGGSCCGPTTPDWAADRENQ